MRTLLAAGTFVLLAAYPFIVYLLMDRGELRVAGLALLGVLVIRWLAPGGARQQTVAALATGVAFAAAIALTNSETLARLYPVAVSATLLAAFGATLLRPPSMIERIARATGPALDERGVRYTRVVTVIWCGFFVANGAVALATALVGSRATWALYNGLVSYLLAGALLVGERVVREFWRRRPVAGG